MRNWEAFMGLLYMKLHEVYNISVVGNWKASKRVQSFSGVHRNEENLEKEHNIERMQMRVLQCLPRPRPWTLFTNTTDIKCFSTA